MTATNQNFEMYAGDTKNIVVTVTNPDSTAVNLTGATVKWALKDYLGAANHIYKDTVNGGVSITNAVSGIFTVSLMSIDTKPLSGVYIHEAVVIDSSSNTSTVMIGNITIDSATI